MDDRRSRKDKADKNGTPYVIKDDPNKPAFEFDCLTNIDRVDPLIPKLNDFDWEVLRRLLNESKDEMGASDYALLADVLKELLVWIVKGADLSMIGRRAVALAWTVNPDLFNGGPSAAALAKAMGCSKDMLHRESAEARRSFGVANRASGHGWNFKPGTPDAKADERPRPAAPVRPARARPTR